MAGDSAASKGELSTKPRRAPPSPRPRTSRRTCLRAAHAPPPAAQRQSPSARRTARLAGAGGDVHALEAEEYSRGVPPVPAFGGTRKPRTISSESTSPSLVTRTSKETRGGLAAAAGLPRRRCGRRRRSPRGRQPAVRARPSAAAARDPSAEGSTSAREARV